MTTMKIRDVSMYVDVLGHGDPLLLMHGGPGLDHVSLTPFRQLADRHTVVLYDHRCNGRSTGAAVTSMTWENLTADADALREELGSSGGPCSGIRSAARSPSSTRSVIHCACHASSCWTRQRRAMVAGERSRRPRWPRRQPEDGGGRSPLLQRADRPEGLRPRVASAPPAYDHRFQPPAARPRDARGRLAGEDAARGARLRRPADAAAGASWIGSARSGCRRSSSPGVTTSSSRPRARPSSPPASRTLGSASSSGPVTTPSPSGRPRRWRPSRTSSRRRLCSRPRRARTRPSYRQRPHEPDHGRYRKRARQGPHRHYGRPRVREPGSRARHQPAFALAIVERGSCS